MHGLTNRHTGDQRRFTLGGEVAHHRQVTFGGFLQYRHGGFRPDQQVHRFGAETQITVQRQLRVELGRVPFHALRDVALNCGDRQWCAGRAGPRVAFEGDTRHPRAQQKYQTGRDKAFATRLQQAPRVVDQRRRQCQNKRHQPRATDRRKPGQWPIKLTVTGVQPRKTSEEPAAKRFLPDP